LTSAKGPSGLRDLPQCSPAGYWRGIVSTHPCPDCGTQTSNRDLCDACGEKLLKEAARKAKERHDKRQGNGKK